MNHFTMQDDFYDDDEANCIELATKLFYLLNRTQAKTSLSLSE